MVAMIAMVAMVTIVAMVMVEIGRLRSVRPTRVEKLSAFRILFRLPRFQIDLFHIGKSRAVYSSRSGWYSSDFWGSLKHS